MSTSTPYSSTEGEKINKSNCFHHRLRSRQQSEAELETSEICSLKIKDEGHQSQEFCHSLVMWHLAMRPMPFCN